MKPNLSMQSPNAAFQLQTSQANNFGRQASATQFTTPANTSQKMNNFQLQDTLHMQNAFEQMSYQSLSQSLQLALS